MGNAGRAPLRSGVRGRRERPCPGGGWPGSRLRLWTAPRSVLRTPTCLAGWHSWGAGLGGGRPTRPGPGMRDPTASALRPFPAPRGAGRPQTPGPLASLRPLLPHWPRAARGVTPPGPALTPLRHFPVAGPGGPRGGLGARASRCHRGGRAASAACRLRRDGSGTRAQVSGGAGLPAPTPHGPLLGFG